MVRYNSTTPAIEAYVNNAWTALATSSGGVSLSALTSATGTNTIDNTTYAQTWTWNTLTTQNALTLCSSSETTGSMLTLTNSNNSGAGNVLNVSTATTGAGAAVSATISGASNTGYAVYANNASASGWGVYSAGASPNYFAGAVGIGTAAPNAGVVLDLGSNTSSMLLPIGTTGTRPGTGINGMMRYNSGNGKFEAYQQNVLAAFCSAAGNGIALSSLTSATATNSIDNTTYAQTWTWNTLTTQNALTLSSSGETSGSLLTLTNSNTAGAGPVLNVSTATTGAGAAVNATISGASNTGYAVAAANSSASGFSFYASGTSPSAFLGAVTIGATSAPTAGTALDLSSNTSSMLLPIGTTGTRPGTGINGMVRYNSTTPAIEAYVNNAWTALATSSGGVSLSALTSATGTNTIDNTTYAQTWTWNTLTTQNALTLSSSSETTGSMLTLTNSNNSGAGNVLNVSTATTGAGAAVSATISGASNTGYAVYANNAIGLGCLFRRCIT